MFAVKREEITDLVKKLNAVVSSTSKGEDLSYYGNVKVIGEGEWLFLHVYGKSINAKAAIKRVGDLDQFSYGTKAEQFIRLIPAFPKSSPDVFFDFKGGNKAMIRSGGSKFDIRVFQDDDIFPLSQDVPDFSLVPTVDLGRFISKLKQVAYCRALKQEDHSYRGLICVNKDHFVATDGYRLSYTVNDVLPIEEEEEGILLSADNVDRILRIYDQNSGLGKIAVTPGSLFLYGQTIFTTVRRSNGKYPNYKSVLPKGGHHRVVVDRVEMLSAIKRALIFSNPGIDTIRVTILPGAHLLIAVSGLHGTADESVMCKESHIEDAVEFGINGKYLAEAFKNRNAEVVCVEFKTSNDPIVLTGEGHADIILPIREDR